MDLLKKVKIAELIQTLDELLMDHDKMKKNEEVVKLMNYVESHLFNKIHIESSIIFNCSKFVAENPFA